MIDTPVADDAPDIPAVRDYMIALQQRIVDSLQRGGEDPFRRDEHSL